MKRLISILLITTIFFSTFFCISSYAASEDEISTDISETISEIFSELETETLPGSNKDPIKLPTEDLYYGDINTDGLITAADARIVLQFCAKTKLLTRRQCILADINANKAVNAQDARIILRIAAKIDKTKLCPDATNTSDMEFLVKYDERKFYKPYLKGFTTNITDEAVFKQIKTLEDYCAKLSKVVTFYFTDVNNEYYIQYNSDKVYRTQCTVKAPYVKSMLDYIESKNIPLSKVIYLKSNQKWNGHYLSNFRTGTGFTISELMYYALRNSDNTAYQMLFDYFGPEILNKNAEKVGAKLRLSTYMFGETSAQDMAKLYLDIYKYNGKYKNEFFTNLKNSNTSPLIKNGIPNGVQMLRKSGSGGNATIGYHDAAVVLTEKPYVLIIYTSINFDRYYDRVPFRRIAEMTYDINTTCGY